MSERLKVSALVMGVGLTLGVVAIAACGEDATIQGLAPGGTSSGQAPTPAPTTAPPAPSPSLAQVEAPQFSPAAGTYTTAQTVTITTTTPNATIFYTTNGTNPSLASQVYVAPLPIRETTTVRAFATVTGMADSPIVAAEYKINSDEVAQAVTFLPDPGESNNPLSVGLQTTTDSAAICYTVDGSDPLCKDGGCFGSAAKYNAGQPIHAEAPIGGGEYSVKAIACKAGIAPSEVKEGKYSFRAAAPTATPAPATPPPVVAYGTPLSIQTATAPNGSKTPSLHYNLDSDADPTCILSQFTAEGAGFSIPAQRNVSIRVVACRGDYAASTVGAFSYSVKVSDPLLDATNPFIQDHVPIAADPPASSIRVTIHANDPVGGVTEGVLCFSTGAAQPACNDDKTTCATGSGNAASAKVVADSTTVNVVACKPGYLDSAVVSGVYHLVADKVHITPKGPAVPLTAAAPDGGLPKNAAGQFSGTDQTVSAYWNAGTDADFLLTTNTLSTVAGDVRIRWAAVPMGSDPVTVDCNGNTPPTGVSEVIGGSASTGVLSASQSVTITAVACKTGYAPSAPHTMQFIAPAQ